MLWYTLQVTDELSSNAFRLMALAVGVLPKVANLDLQQMSQQQLERRAEKLEMLGLIVLTNHIKPDSKNTVTELQDKYTLRLLCMQHSGCVACYTQATLHAA